MLLLKGGVHKGRITGSGWDSYEQFSTCWRSCNHGHPRHFVSARQRFSTFLLLDCSRHRSHDFRVRSPLDLHLSTTLEKETQELITSFLLSSAPPPARAAWAAAPPRSALRVRA